MLRRLSSFLARNASADDRKDAERERHGDEVLSTESKESPQNFPVLETETRNNCPISQLPPELLVLIFDECIHSRDAILFEKPLYFAFSQVCHDWRELALNTPTLWTKPDFRWPLWAQEMLRRSKEADLDITYRVESGAHNILSRPFEEAMLEALSNASRITNISFNLWDTIGFEGILASLVQPAPLLHTLCLHFYSTLAEDPFPERLLGDHAPSLRNLSIEGSHLRWTSPLLKNLTSFSLRSHDHYPMDTCSLCPTAEQFIEIMSAMPDLQYLNLQNVAFRSSNPSRTTHTSPIVEFPHLRFLRADYSVSDSVPFLSRLSIPSTTTIDITCDSRNTGANETHYVSLFACLSRLSSKHSVDNLLLESVVLSAASDNDVCFCLKAWDSTATATTNATRITHVELYMYLDQHPSVDLIQTAVRSVPIHDLTTLNLHSINISSETLLDRFGALPKLSNLILTFERDPQAPDTSFVAALEHDGAFPALETIYIRGLDFTELLRNDCFAKTLKRRGAPLRRLELRECVELPKWEVNRIQEVARNVEVDWDGCYIRREGSEIGDDSYEDSDEYYEQQVSDYE